MADSAQKEIDTILKKHNLRSGYEMVFPQYRILPDEVKLAISVLSKHGMIIRFTLTPVEKKKK